jgi:hypothetical protein
VQRGEAAAAVAATAIPAATSRNRATKSAIAIIIIMRKNNWVLQLLCISVGRGSLGLTASPEELQSTTN